MSYTIKELWNGDWWTWTIVDGLPVFPSHSSRTRKPVPTDDSVCAHFIRTGRIRLRSANLAELGYDAEGHRLLAVFRAGPDWLYVYRNVSVRTWIGIWLAPSAGRYFNSVIRSNPRAYPYTRRKL